MLREILINFVSRQQICRYLSTGSKLYKANDDPINKSTKIPRLPDAQFQTAHLIKEKGKIYDKKPFRMLCERGKVYMWCACGRSKTQPLCDGSHKYKQLGPPSPNKPVKFVPEEDGEVWFCNCKQTDNRPFCDGTHKRQDIQETVR
uniref:Iron-binding zinc finger CDGSH type domain-containing protein n=1 Tax=Strigamia maritima TaxID=126957 RepID=T1JCX5_STRMM